MLPENPTPKGGNQPQDLEQKPIGFHCFFQIPKCSVARSLRCPPCPLVYWDGSVPSHCQGCLAPLRGLSLTVGGNRARELTQGGKGGGWLRLCQSLTQNCSAMLTAIRSLSWLKADSLFIKKDVAAGPISQSWGDCVPADCRGCMEQVTTAGKKCP